MAVASLDAGGTAETAGLVVGDVFIRFNGLDVHMLGQKEMVQNFVKAGANSIQLVVKKVGCVDSIWISGLFACMLFFFLLFFF